MCCVEGRDGHVRLFSFCSFKTTQLLKNIFSRKISVHLPIYFFLFLSICWVKKLSLVFFQIIVRLLRPILFSIFWKIRSFSKMILFQVRTTDLKLIVFVFCFKKKMFFHFSERLKVVLPTFFFSERHHRSRKFSSFTKWCTSLIQGVVG